MLNLKTAMNLEDMDAPCVCDNCGDWFDLQDGNPQENEVDSTIYCPRCVKEPWGFVDRKRKQVADE